LSTLDLPHQASRSSIAPLLFHTQVLHSRCALSTAQLSSIHFLLLYAGIALSNLIISIVQTLL
jgi:hypothetical protein